MSRILALKGYENCRVYLYEMESYLYLMSVIVSLRQIFVAVDKPQHAAILLVYCI